MLPRPSVSSPETQLQGSSAATVSWDCAFKEPGTGVTSGFIPLGAVHMWSRIIFWGEAVLGTVGCSAASLAPVHLMPGRGNHIWSTSLEGRISPW